MADSASQIAHQIKSANELKAVVRTMKAMAASSITQYEHAVQSLDSYYQTVRTGLGLCLQQVHAAEAGRESDNSPARPYRGDICAIVFGSDQGLIGQFNDTILEFCLEKLTAISAGKPPSSPIWPVGERILSGLEARHLPAAHRFRLPASLNSITELVSDMLTTIESGREANQISEVLLFFHQPSGASSYAPVMQRLLPPDAAWQRELQSQVWSGTGLPEVLNDEQQTLRAFVREYLFVSLFRACAESLASENASRLAAMQRAEKNINDILDDLNQGFQHMRQSSIDAELFDLVAGFEALSGH
jgi:F-type H+-transporting ATPase subunit gamma